MTFLALLFGLLIGSFLNVCIHRWPINKSVVRPRSRCPKCEQQISWYDNIPLLSFTLLRGRCRHCNELISWRYPAVEILNGILYFAAVSQYGLEPISFKCMLFGSMMLALIFTDLEQFLLPDELTLGGLAIGLALSPFILIPAGATQLIWLISQTQPEPWQASVVESILAVIVFGGMLWGTREVYYRVRGVDGLGFGDVKLAGMMGAFWGMNYTLIVLVVGSLIGALFGSALVLFGGKRWQHEMPYGSYLGAAAILVTFWGDDLIGWYWNTITTAAVGP